MKNDSIKQGFANAAIAEKSSNTAIYRATDATKLLGSLAQLGSGRIICCQGGLSLALAADFSRFASNGRDFVFSGGVLELVPETLTILISRAACGLGLGISLFDQQENLQLVFHFCHGSPWGKWMKNHVASGLLEKHQPLGLVPTDLCWCDLWPQQQTASFAMPGSFVQNRLTTLTQSRTIKTTVRTQHVELATVIHPSSFDQLASSVRFWDRPRTRVCYADLTCVEPMRHEAFVSLES